MLDRIDRVNPRLQAYAYDQDAKNDLLELLGFLFRNKGIICLSFLISVLLAVAYYAVAPARYAATAQIIIDPDNARVGRQESRIDNPIDASTIESQVAVIKSERIAQAVVEALQLSQDEEFVPSKPGILQTALSYMGAGSAPPTDDERKQIAVERLQKSLDVWRVGISYVINVEYSSKSKEKSARIANNVAQSYLQAQSDMRSEAIRSADKWLEDRLSVIRTETLAAENALQEFKAQAKNASAGAVLVDLESYAKLKRNLYESFLQRHMEIAQHEVSSAVVARILSPASPPLSKSEPKLLLVLGAGGMLGLVLGVAAAFIREGISKAREGRAEY